MDLMIFDVAHQADSMCAKVYRATQVIRYRGTFSDVPTLGTFAPGAGTANEELFRVFMDLHDRYPDDELPLIHDLDTAIHMTGLLARYEPGHQYEIVELTAHDAKPEIGRRLIGYDVSIGYNLSLVWIVFIAYEAPPEGAPIEGEWPEELKDIRPFIDLMYAYFCPKLNADGLFSTFADAEFFLRCARAQNHFHPDLWESRTLLEEFEVVGFYEVCIH